jgi:hypothetical protein
MRGSDRRVPSGTALQFEELAATLEEMPGVLLGRSYGRWCIKLRQNAFIALDGEQIAFCVGARAASLVERFPSACLWNPRKGRRPKQCWIAVRAGGVESVATLGAMAYQFAVEIQIRQDYARISDQPGT